MTPSPLMQLLVLLARIFLFGVFAISGIAKLAAPARARQSVLDFGVPAAVATPLTVVLVVAELSTAVALLPVTSARYGALSALVLLLLFSGAIAANLARGRTPDCNCFGQLHSEPIGWQTIARNAVLACIALLVVWGARAPGMMSVIAWAGAMTPEQLALVTAGVVLTALLVATLGTLFQVLRQQGRLLLRFEALESQLGIGSRNGSAQQEPHVGLPPDTRAPGFELQTLDGGKFALDDLLAEGKDLLLVFTHPGCEPCRALMPDVARWQKDVAHILTIALISDGTVAENKAKIGAHGIERLYLQSNREVSELYQAYGTPSAVLVNKDGTIASYVVGGAAAIRGLLEFALSRRATAPGIPVGDPVPPLRLQDLDGMSITNAQLQGRRTVLLFWNPQCGFCQQMLPDLKSWELNRPPGAPELLVVSVGSEPENRALKLRSPVVIEPQLSGSFGANGTPMAVLIDAHVRVASDVAAGAEAVFALMRNGSAAGLVGFRVRDY